MSYSFMKEVYGTGEEAPCFLDSYALLSIKVEKVEVNIPEELATFIVSGRAKETLDMGVWGTFPPYEDNQDFYKELKDIVDAVKEASIFSGDLVELGSRTFEHLPKAQLVAAAHRLFDLKKSSKTSVLDKKMISHFIKEGNGTADVSNGIRDFGNVRTILQYLLDVFDLQEDQVWGESNTEDGQMLRSFVRRRETPVNVRISLPFASARAPARPTAAGPAPAENPATAPAPAAATTPTDQVVAEKEAETKKLSDMSTSAELKEANDKNESLMAEVDTIQKNLAKTELATARLKEGDQSSHHHATTTTAVTSKDMMTISSFYDSLERTTTCTGCKVFLLQSHLAAMQGMFGYGPHKTTSGAVTNHCPCPDSRKLEDQLFAQKDKCERKLEAAQKKEQEQSTKIEKLTEEVDRMRLVVQQQLFCSRCAATMTNNANNRDGSNGEEETTSGNRGNEDGDGIIPGATNSGDEIIPGETNSAMSSSSSSSSSSGTSFEMVSEHDDNVDGNHDGSGW